MAEVAYPRNLARFHAKLNPVPGYFGPTALESVQTARLVTGRNPDQADEAVAELLDGSRTSNSAPVADYEQTGQPMPEVGALGIVLDGAGHPRALVVTTDAASVEEAGRRAVRRGLPLLTQDADRPGPGLPLVRWIDHFDEHHGGVRPGCRQGGAAGAAPDGSSFIARLPFDRTYGGPVAAEAFIERTAPPSSWGVLLVRKGGFAVARLSGPGIVESKVGQRHVQGRTKAGGQSQQRFARRRDNQARQAYLAAADHASRILGHAALVVVTGGDHAAVDEVLADPRLRRLTVLGPWLPVPDPKRHVLEEAVELACAIQIEVVNA